MKQYMMGISCLKESDTLKYCDKSCEVAFLISMVKAVSKTQPHEY